MAGNKSGGIKAAETNRKKFGNDFYRRIGALGGKAGNTGGFFADRELAKRAGSLGGKNRWKQHNERKENELDNNNKG